MVVFFYTDRFASVYFTLIKGIRFIYFESRQLIVLLNFLGKTSVRSTIFLPDYTYDRSEGTTPLIPKNGSSGTQLASHYLSSTLLYILIVLVGIFVIICGIFVGTYFYNHCIIQTYLTQSKTTDQLSNQREEYNSLEMNVHEESIHSRDQTYLEPVSDAKPHYEEIISQNINETTEQLSKTISEQREIKKDSLKRYKRPFIRTNSL